MTPAPPDTVWIYWEGPTLPYIELCARTITAHHHNVRRLDAPAFEALRETDADLDLARLKLNHKADYIRAYLLQRYGGLWLDIDCVVLAPLSPFLEALRICDYIGYRESKYNDPQLGLMASSAGGRIITRHYGKVSSFLRSRKEPEWLDLSSWPMDKALAEERWQGYLQLDQRRIAPISWVDNDLFFIERDDAEHELVFDETALSYMLYNAMIPPWFKALSAEAILDGRTFLSYLFRRALGWPRREVTSPRPKKRLLIGILSARSYTERRDRCRRSWLADAAAADGVDAFFLIGGAQGLSRAGDELFLPCPDDYASLPQKTAWFLKYALDNFDFDYLFKCDDDTYVSIPRLVASLAPVDYSGHDIGGYASGGAGYQLGQTAARRIIDRLRRHPHGDEDVLVGRAVREAGMKLTPNGRFRAWFAPDQVPRPDNDLISTHPVRGDEMLRIHEGLRGAPILAPEKELFEVKSWTTSYGILGLNAGRGFSVDGSDRIDTSRVDFDLAPYTTLSAHASSEVTIVTKVSVAIRGFTDSAASDKPKSPIRFEVDGRPLGSLYAGGRRTREVALTTPGLHTLRAICEGDLTRRYSVWAVRPYRPEGLRIVMPTSNRYVDVARASLELLDRYWPDHPPVDVLRHEREVAAPGSVDQHYAGPQAHVSWVETMRWYFEHQSRDELFLLMLDDYAMCAPVKQAGFDAALAVMRDDPSVASYLLTWMGAPEKRPYPGRADTIVFSRWAYTVNLQAAIWRRSSFLRILKACGTKVNPEAVEIAGTKYFNEREFGTEKAAGANVADPASPSLFLDSVDKEGWILPYHKLAHRGALDERHAGFLAKEGIVVSLPAEGW